MSIDGDGTRAARAADMLRWMDHWVDPVLLLLAALCLPLFLYQTGPLDPWDEGVVTAANWMIWGAFTANFVVRMSVAPQRGREFRNLAFDLILILGQPLLSLGPRTAQAWLGLARFAVVVARGLRRGRLLRRSGEKLRRQPLRIVAFLVPFVWVLGGAIELRLESADGTITTIGQSLWFMAATLSTVGYGDISPKTGWGRVVAVLTMIVGIGAFSVLTAKLAESLFAARYTRGRREVVERGHTLLLGWSPQLYTIVDELAAAVSAQEPSTIVVLTPHDSEDVSTRIRTHVPRLAHSSARLVCRSGAPHDPATLAVAHPEHAASIVVLDDTMEDAPVVRTLLALLSGSFDIDEDVPVLAQIDNPATAAALGEAFERRITTIDPNSFLARLTAQSCLAPGLALAYQDLLDMQGAQVVVAGPPDVEGHCYGDLLAAYEIASPIGIVRPDGTARLNPPHDTVVGAGDDVVFVADDSAALLVKATPVVATPPRAVPDTAPDGSGRLAQVVIFGWSILGREILVNLDPYLSQDSSVTVVYDPDFCSISPPDPAELTDAALVVRTASGRDHVRAVEDAVGPDVDHVLILCDRANLSAAEADTRALVTLLQVNHALGASGAATSVLTELRDSTDVPLAPRGDAGDFIVSDHLTSLFLTQLSVHRDLAAVFDCFFSSRGASLYAKPAPVYAAGDQETTYAHVAAVAAARGESALGYRLASTAHDPGSGYGVVLNPPKSARVTLAAEDQVLVVADTAD